jgi:hypothetical protein
MLLFGESTWAPVRGGRLDLGTWQRLFLVELFEPRRRTVDVAVLGELAPPGTMGPAGPPATGGRESVP